ncbi:hypothetical protein TorRG33x02_249060 [Trema orientale]|uniref:Uncharacterized protein n=1 Tax=Trema orientale TaxID=63057 RepID=A0A2P5DK42_TREOI|nr:hypothetical protein TorRG33x02_249060 [Trema orientale]
MSQLKHNKIVVLDTKSATSGYLIRWNNSWRLVSRFDYHWTTTNVLPEVQVADFHQSTLRYLDLERPIHR